MISGSRVVVVGGAGFLGSHLVSHLIDTHDCKVIVVDNFSSGRSEFVHHKATVVRADIAHQRLDLISLFGGVDYVFNYASRPYIPDCIDNPVQTMMANTIGSLRVIEAARKCKSVKRILQVTSAEVYGNSNRYERACPDPPSTYAASKLSIDRLAMCRFIEVGAPVIILRQFNCVGARETHPYVIPEIISQVHTAGVEDEHNHLTIKLGNDTERDFMYAGDAVRMATELIEKGEPGQAYNMGSEDSISIYTLAMKIAKIMRPACQTRIVFDGERARKSEIWNLKSDNTKLYKCIDARPDISFEEALAVTIQYYVNNGHSWGW